MKQQSLGSEYDIERNLVLHNLPLIANDADLIVHYDLLILNDRRLILHHHFVIIGILPLVLGQNVIIIDDTALHLLQKRVLGQQILQQCFYVFHFGQRKIYFCCKVSEIIKMTDNTPAPRRVPILYFVFLVSVLGIWLYHVSSLPNVDFLTQRWAAMLTMVFGSFIAGASPEGSAAIAYPVFTLLLEIPPDVTRNFAFAIQSIGMTSASLLIIGMRIKVEWNYIKFVTLGGIFGLIFGTYYVVPLISPVLAKLFFVSLWLSFGIALWKENRRRKREVFDSIQSFGGNDKARLAIFGLIGGIISSIFGTGINIFTFCLMTIYYRVNEKVATPSSVLIMTFETILGFFLHTQILGDFSSQSMELWLACIPVVVFFAPLGAFIVSKLPRQGIAKILYTILVVQFFGALWVIKPNLMQLFMCGLTITVGLGTFAYLANLRKN